MSADSTGSGSQTLNGWYELFSRGARDWLRHNEKIREAVRARLAAEGVAALHGELKRHAPIAAARLMPVKVAAQDAVLRTLRTYAVAPNGAQVPGFIGMRRGG